MKTTITAAATAALLLAGTAAGSAADMAVKARPMAAPAIIWSWTGFYGGVHVGAGWGTSESTLTNVAVQGGDIRQVQTLALLAPAGGVSVPINLPFSQTSSSGFLGGVQAGYNWQAGWAVFGIQGDIAG